MATWCDIPQAVLSILSTCPGQRAGRFLYREGLGCSVYSLFWLKHHKAASSPSKEHRCLQIPLERLRRRSPATTVFVVSPHSAACLLQGTGGILLDELLVTGIADALWVNTGREGQLICWTGFTEDTTTVLADVLEEENRKITGFYRTRKLEFSLYNLQLTQILYWTRERCPLWRPETCPCAQDQATMEQIMSKSR